MDVYAGQNQRYEGVEKDLDYDDGGEEYDWNSTCIVLPECKDPKTWLEEIIKEDEERETKTVGLELPQVSPFSLYKFVENRPDYHPLRLVVSGTAGTGKSYVIKCLQRLVLQVFGTNDAIEVITPTGSAASTVHSFLGIPTGGRSSNELTVPAGPVLERSQKKCENLKVLVGNEWSMFGRTTMGWMEHHVRYAVNRAANVEM